MSVIQQPGFTVSHQTINVDSKSRFRYLNELNSMGSGVGAF